MTPWFFWLPLPHVGPSTPPGPIKGWAGSGSVCFGLGRSVRRRTIGIYRHWAELSKHFCAENSAPGTETPGTRQDFQREGLEEEETTGPTSSAKRGSSLRLRKRPSFLMKSKSLAPKAIDFFR